MQLRPYQENAVCSIFDYFLEHAGNPIVGMPTGTGKSLVIGEFIKRACNLYPGTRVLKLTHVKELIEQNHDKLMKLWPTAPAGIYSAGLNRREITSQILYAGIASVAKHARRIGHVDLIVIDECHLVSPKAETQYQAFIGELRQINPYLKVIGLTATYYRLGQGLLTEPGSLFTDVCFDLTKRSAFNQLVKDAYLAPLITKRMNLHTDPDEAGVKMSGGDYNLKQLQEFMNDGGVTRMALEEALDRGQDRHHWLVFTTGVEHTEDTAAMLNYMGQAATFVHSKLPAAERDQRIADFKAGRYRMMVNNNILTTGFDYPGIDHIVVLRPTKSTSLWVQMLGRGTRPVYADGFDLGSVEGRLQAIAYGGKRNCLVSDFARNSEELGPINDPVLPKSRKKKKKGTAPVRCCESCGAYNHASARTCDVCGAEFSFDIKYSNVASTADVIAQDENPDIPKVEPQKVDRVVYTIHRKEDRPDSIRADYYCGMRRFTAYVCLEHKNFAKKKAYDWWRSHAGIPEGMLAHPADPDNYIPETTAEAIKRVQSLPTPTMIHVWTNTKYPEILSYEFGTSTSSPEAPSGNVSP